MSAEANTRSFLLGTMFIENIAISFLSIQQAFFFKKCAFGEGAVWGIADHLEPELQQL